MFDRRTFFIREHVGMMKLKNTYDILLRYKGVVYEYTLD